MCFPLFSIYFISCTYRSQSTCKINAEFSIPFHKAFSLRKCFPSVVFIHSRLPRERSHWGMQLWKRSFQCFFFSQLCIWIRSILIFSLTIIKLQFTFSEVWWTKPSFNILIEYWKFFTICMWKIMCCIISRVLLL